MLKRTALIKNSKVHNIIMAETDYRPPKGLTVIETETADIGDSYDGENFAKPEPPHSKGELISHAKLWFQTEINRGVTFDLADPGDPPQIVQIPADNTTREEIAALAFVAELDRKDLSLVTRDRVLSLSPDHILNLREGIMRHVAESYARLADQIRAIEEGRITSIGEIDGF